MGLDIREGTGSEIFLWTVLRTRLSIGFATAYARWKFNIAHRLVAARAIYATVGVKSGNYRRLRRVHEVLIIRGTSYELDTVIEPEVVVAL